MEDLDDVRLLKIDSLRRGKGIRRNSEGSGRGKTYRSFPGSTTQEGGVKEKREMERRKKRREREGRRRIDEGRNGKRNRTGRGAADESSPAGIPRLIGGT